jgi:hypothetical protein
MADWNTDRRGKSPPNGFEVMTSKELDAVYGRPDRWLYHGKVGRRSCIRGNFKTRADACRGAWLAFDAACNILARGPGGIGARAGKIDPLGQIPDEFTVALADWDHMTADLLSQIIYAAGSIRRAALVIDVPRSTLSAWVRMHRERGTWPA